MQRFLFLLINLLSNSHLNAQKVVLFREQPHQNPFLLNQYVRIIDAIIQPAARPVNHCKNCTVLPETDKARIHQLIANPGAAIDGIKSKNPLILLVIDRAISIEEREKGKIPERGKLYWMAPDVSINIFNKSVDRNTLCYLNEIKLPASLKKEILL